MMRRTFFGVGVLSVLLLVGISRPVAAQGLASLVATSASSTSVEKRTCWGCTLVWGIGACVVGGGTNGTCKTNFANACDLAGTCQSASLTPMDPDGASQSVSREGRLGTLVMMKEGDPEIRRDCAGVLVARFQSPDEIAAVRSQTGTLIL